MDKETRKVLKRYYKSKGAKLINVKELKSFYVAEIMLEEPQSHLEATYISKEVVQRWKKENMSLAKVKFLNG